VLPGGREILRRAEEVRSPEIDYAVEFVLKATDPASSWKERTASYMMIAHGKDYSLVMMREPSQFYPGTLLIAKGFYWLLLPRSEKAFQLAPRHVLNGDISNGDLARGNLLAFYEVRLQGEATIRGEPCCHLELTRTTNLAMYKKIHAWITKKDYRPWRFHYYGETGALLKVADYEDYRETALGIRSMRIRVQNKIRPGEETVPTFSNLRQIDASVLDFTRQGLPAFRNAALAKKKLDGEQAQAEDLLRALGNPGQ
jgi:outer membrane lipoprotein-sorting protein